LSFRASCIGEGSAFATKEQIPRAVGPRFRMTILNKYLNCTTAGYFSYQDWVELMGWLIFAIPTSVSD
jgi:hypothetical protein